ncbi:MAG TPA: TIGR04283 family arsenosugar biosynthesis glycosyltransferase [Flavobacteriaceae bacterium]|nr:TIGR04283 family arsenosugar biosynthesis glycosyltransferase [Flavobacteriaceae bacterium]MCB9213908.1 TIGR04283 family arsenosugar biosynthesis glycosyltransferase [Alteromonas sp.]HPF11107.1 TIGR04283 family arsenosugar biosynthesis glycosyltransferase [Flavobacteriaceae bacterium]HQU21225.1 TIGR04283 family arsenosugar biosynthesis glycosyltransferase [Flavobacteriaceae bacterium]HQU65697.1 TIGR04283 family arsenosugar biosynthesis glycosyltransferase [Flavobacteriaceae bacterium]
MISIIIPVLNESQTIGKLLLHLTKEIPQNTTMEIIVVDGGSKDNTLEEVAHFSGLLPIKTIRTSKGRAVQMNRGAQEASGSILYFLHADTVPPFHFEQSITKALLGKAIAGCFRMKFDSKHPILLVSQWFTRFNFKACRGGDQSLFVEKEVFDALGGFNEQFEVYEDCEFINRLYDHGPFIVLKDSVVTSARRYRSNGTAKLQFHFAIIHLKKWFGTSPQGLVSYYNKYIAS